MLTLKKSWMVLSLLALAAGCGSSGGGGSSAIIADDPALQTNQTVLNNALRCTQPEHEDKPTVLLVHGTVTTGTEQYTAFYAPQLAARGFDVCIVTYPDRGFIDQQISAEYVVNALRKIHQDTGRKVAMIGHSQGASMPRWALRFFPSAREAVEDFVLIAGPNHGTLVSLPADLPATVFDLLGLNDFPVGLLPESIYQFSPTSDFVAAVNSGDETPGNIDYTNLYTLFDELVQPATPTPTAALDFGQNNPRVSNLLLQDVCPGHLADHLTIGTSDALAFALALDAISNPGPANVERAGGASQLCGMLPVNLEDLAMPENIRRLLEIVESDVQTGPPNLHLAPGEPALMPYARNAADG